MTTRVSASPVAVRKASSSSTIITRLCALSTSGRFAVMRRTAPSFSYVMVRKFMVGLLGGEGVGLAPSPYPLPLREVEGSCSLSLPEGKGRGEGAPVCERFDLARELLGHRRLHHRALEEIGIHRGVQTGGIAEDELAQLGLGDEAVLDHLVGLLEHLGHVDHVEMTNVGAEDGPQSVAAVLVESPRRRHGVGLAAEVEALGEMPAQLLGGGDGHRGEVVDLFAVGALCELVDRLERLDQTEAGEHLVHLLLVDAAPVAREEVLQRLEAEEIGRAHV